MGFFFNTERSEAKTKPVKKARLADIPVHSLQALGCSVCPRDKDASKLRSPKMEPSGTRDASVYLLGTAPSEEEDEDNNHWTDKAGNAIYRAFGADFMQREVRSNFITQCRGDQTAVEVECCRPRIVDDIERVKPLIVVGVGDAPLSWVTGVVGGAMPHRGSLFVTKIGKHVCWYFQILYPNFVHKKGYGKSEYELALEHDARTVKALVRELSPARVYEAPYDTGVEIVTGTEPGDYDRLARALVELATVRESAIDVETTGLRPYMQREPRILTCAVGTFNRTVAFAVDHPEGWGTVDRRKQVKGLLMRYLLDSGKKSAHNLALEMEWLGYEFGNDILRRTEWDDTMAMAHTLDERQGTKSLDFQCRLNFGFFLKQLSNIDTSRLLEYPLARVLKYNGMDAKWTDKLRDTLRPKINADPSLVYEYERKVRLAPTLVLTETMGLQTDIDYAKKMETEFKAVVYDLETRIARCPEVKEYAQRFGTFSPSAPDQVLRLMRDVCKRDEVRVEDKRTKAVRWTTDEDALARIPAREVPSVPLILEHRGSSKLVGTYIEPVTTGKIVCPDGLIRSKYSSMTAETGRLAADDPAVQNWPKRKHRKIRGIIRSKDGRWIVAADYGQIEFRVVGMASEDENLVKYCWTGYDVHKFWAQRMVDLHPGIIDWVVEEFGVDWDEVGLKTLRQEAKNKWVFPQLFGSSIRSCAEQLHLPENIAQELGEEFWDEFPGVKRWQKKLLEDYNRTLYVETLSGRKRRGPMTPNQVINHPVQGTAADIVLEGMNAVSERATLEEDPELQPVLNVHDDLTFDLADGSLETKLPVIAYEMCKPRFDYINVPLIVEVSVGQRWHDLTEIQVYRSNEIFGTANPYA